MSPFSTLTARGALFPLDCPVAADVRWRDVACGLSRINRFNGATLAPYTVAQHSVFVADLVTAVLSCGVHPIMVDGLIARTVAEAACNDHLADKIRLAALLHDAHEAFTGDITAPVERLLARLTGGDPVGQIKRQVDAAVYAAADLPWPLPPGWRALIDAADARACATEVRDLLPQTPATLALLRAGPGPAPAHLRPLTGPQAESKFLNAINELTGESQCQAV